MNPNIKAKLKVFFETEEDTADTYVAYLNERNGKKRELLLNVYKKLDFKRDKLINELNESILEIL